MTSHEPENPHSTDPDNPDTEVITIAAPAPVFVDSTGRRSRRLRRLAYAFGVLVMVYGGLISVSLAGGPVRSSAVLPLPGLEPDTESEKLPVRPSSTPASSPSQVAATAKYLTEGMPRRTFVPRPPPQRIESTVRAKPAPAKPSPSATPKSTVRTKPTESTSTKPATKAPTKPPTRPTSTPPTLGTPPATVPVTVPPVVGPLPPGKAVSPRTGTGGQGGGEGGSPVFATDDATSPSPSTSVSGTRPSPSASASSTSPSPSPSPTKSVDRPGSTPSPSASSTYPSPSPSASGTSPSPTKSVDRPGSTPSPSADATETPADETDPSPSSAGTDLFDTRTSDELAELTELTDQIEADLIETDQIETDLIETDPEPAAADTPGDEDDEGDA